MKYIYTILFFTVIFSQVLSQTIANTRWKTFSASLSDTISIDITSDTIYQYIRPDTMLAVSLYTQKSDTIELIDVAGIFACIITDTGLYHIEVMGDTMLIDLLSDQCFSRSLVYDGAVLWRVDAIIGIHNFKKDLQFKLYPNPSNGYISIETENKGKIIVYNSVGQIVIQKEIYNLNSHTILMLKPGSYVVKYQSKQGVSAQRLIVW